MYHDMDCPGIGMEVVAYTFDFRTRLVLRRYTHRPGVADNSVCLLRVWFQIRTVKSINTICKAAGAYF